MAATLGEGSLCLSSGKAATSSNIAVVRSAQVVHTCKHPVSAQQCCRMDFDMRWLAPWQPAGPRQSCTHAGHACCRLMGAVAEAVGSGLGAEHVIGVIPAALAPREVGQARHLSAAAGANGKPSVCAAVVVSDFAVQLLCGTLEMW